MCQKLTNRHPKETMSSHLRAFFLLLLAAPALQSLPQQRQQAPAPDLGRIVLNVVVTSKSGQPVSGLRQQDFTILDNRTPQTMTSFAAVDGRQAPVDVVIVIDAVNIGYENVARQRQAVEKFLRMDGGHLAFPTTIAVSSDKGIEMQPDSSRDGNALSASLEQSDIGLRNIRRSAGFTAPTSASRFLCRVSSNWPCRKAPSQAAKSFCGFLRAGRY